MTTYAAARICQVLATVGPMSVPDLWAYIPGRTKRSLRKVAGQLVEEGSVKVRSIGNPMVFDVTEQGRRIAAQPLPSEERAPRVIKPKTQAIHVQQFKGHGYGIGKVSSVFDLAAQCT